MKSTRKLIVGIAAVASLGIAAAVYAAEGTAPAPGTGPCAANGPGMGMGPMGGMHGPRGPQGMHRFGGEAGDFDPAAMIDGRLAYLKTRLKITAAQDAAWQAFNAKVRQQGVTMHANRAALQNASGSAPEQMAVRVTTMKQNVGSMETMVGALKDLYTVLTPEQKALADKHFDHMRQGFGRHFR